MMRFRLKQLLVTAFTLCVAGAWGQDRSPHIGYLYPSGGKQGEVVRITVGGQFLKGETEVYVSGEGVSAKVLQYCRPSKNLMQDQRKDLTEKLRECRDKQLAKLPDGGRAFMDRNSALGKMGPYKNQAPAKENAPAKKNASAKNNATKAKKTTSAKNSTVTNGNAPAKTNAAKGKAKAGAAKAKDSAPAGAAKTDAAKADAEKKPAAKKPAVFRPYEHPLLYELENKNLRELRHVAYQIFFPRDKKQDNAQLLEMALIEITIDPEAAPGDREFRLGGPAGLTNPMVFQVGQLPEANECEPNDPRIFVPPNEPKAPPLQLPVVLNGQIMPGDVDRHTFRAVKGQQLVIEASARQLIPYLADAVPGWFQATVALYSPAGKEVAFGDDYRFSPDPVLFYKVPEDGDYELEVRDSIYRGREDFVYRVSVAEKPFIKQAFPLGGKDGTKTVATVSGWNLPKTTLPLNTKPGGALVRHTALNQGQWRSNEVAYAVDELPEILETEPNNDLKKAQAVELPRIVNGRIGEPGDVDVFWFTGRAGDQVVAEVVGRRLNSPIDSVLRLTDSAGKVVEWNDDYMAKDGHLHLGAGLITHHADSYLTAKLPADGSYYAHVTDTQKHGGEEYAYRLRLTPPQPDFALRVGPSSVNLAAGRLAPLTVYALRREGFDGEIELAVKNADSGFTIEGGSIPAGRDRVRVTLRAPEKAPNEPVAVELVGRAKIGGKTVSRLAAPADDAMQAFLWRHLAPAQEMLVAVQKTKYRAAPVQLVDKGRIKIPAGGQAQVVFKVPPYQKQQGIDFKLMEPPEGVTLGSVKPVPIGVMCELKVDGEKVKVGYADNLIVEAFGQTEYGPNNANGKRAKRSLSLGVLPAIPIEVVAK